MKEFNLDKTILVLFQLQNMLCDSSTQFRCKHHHARVVVAINPRVVLSDHVLLKMKTIFGSQIVSRIFSAGPTVLPCTVNWSVVTRLWV